MTTDLKQLVMRLRQHALPDPHDEREVLHAPLLCEAANAIERLARVFNSLADEMKSDRPDFLRCAGLVAEAHNANKRGGSKE